LNLPTSARAAALGYNVLSISDNDISLVNTNPSLLNSEMHNILVLSFVDYFADINYGYATYAHSFSKTEILLLHFNLLIMVLLLLPILQVRFKEVLVQMS
jgi:hypothetical protein